MNRGIEGFSHPAEVSEARVEEYKVWCKENGHTFHECPDCNSVGYSKECFFCGYEMA